MKMSNEWLSGSSFGVTIIPGLGSLFIPTLVVQCEKLAYLESPAFSLKDLDSVRSVKQVPRIQPQQKTPRPWLEAKGHLNGGREGTFAL